MTEKTQALVDAVKNADSEDVVKDIIKSNTRTEYADACNELGLNVNSNDQKADLFDKILKADIVTKEIATSDEVIDEPVAKVENPVLEINPRLEAIDLGPKIGVIAIVDGDVPVHIPNARVIKTLDGYMIGRA